MASKRETIIINASTDEVWAEITNPLAMVKWWTGVVQGEMTDRGREVQMDDGVKVIERIVTNDSELRRLQYSVYDGDLHKLNPPLEDHISTIDVFEIEEKALVVYSLNVTPDLFGGLLIPQIKLGLESLKKYLEKK